MSLLESLDACKNMSLDINHKNHALGDEMHIFSLVWALKDNYKTINIHIDYKLMSQSRGSGYSNYISPFIRDLYSVIPSVTLIESNSGTNKGVTKEHLGKLVSHSSITLPNLFNLGIIPDKMITKLPPSGTYIVIPTRIRYPPSNVSIQQFVEFIGKLSTQITIILIGERKLDKENNEIFTIYDRIVSHFSVNKLVFIDYTSSALLYRGVSKLEHLWLDLNVIKNAQCVVTFGISGLIDLSSMVTDKVYTIGNFKQSYSKLIWNNSKHGSLIKCRDLLDLSQKVFKQLRDLSDDHKLQDTFCANH
jgi:hypothetical protein